MDSGLNSAVKGEMEMEVEEPKPQKIVGPCPLERKAFSQSISGLHFEGSAKISGSHWVGTLSKVEQENSKVVAPKHVLKILLTLLWPVIRIFAFRLRIIIIIRKTRPEVGCRQWTASEYMISI